MQVQFKKSDIIKADDSGFKTIFSVRLPKKSIQLPLNKFTGVANRKCIFLEEKGMCVQVDVGFMGYLASADALITMNEMGYDFNEIDELKRAKKEKSEIKEFYLKLVEDNPSIFESSDNIEDTKFEIPKLEKEKSKVYKNLNIDIKWLEEEIISYHTMKNHGDTSVFHKGEITFLQIGSGRWAFGTIINGNSNDFKVSTGPLQVVKAKSAGFVATTALLTGGIGLAVKAAGAASDKVKGDQFMKFIDEKIYQNQGNGPDSNQEVQNNANVEDDIPSKIKKLSELKDQGILTQEEFDTKKADLLSKM